MILAGSACARETRHALPGCKSYALPGPVYDLADPGADTGYIFASIQDRHQTDSAGEWINDGSIQLINRKTFEVIRPPVQGRDDYPFKPLGIDVLHEKNETYLYVVNEAFRAQRSLEVYRIFKGSLVFQRRVRLYRMKEAVDVSAVSTDEIFIATRGQGFFGLRPDGNLIVYRSGLYRSLPVALGSPYRFGSSAQGITLVPSPEQKRLLEVWSGGNVRTLIELEFPPVAANRNESLIAVMQKSDNQSTTAEAQRLTVIRNGDRRDYFLPPGGGDAVLLLSLEKKLMLASESGSSSSLVVCDQP